MLLSHSTDPILVEWDLENGHLKTPEMASKLKSKISDSLKNLNMMGPITINAFGDLRNPSVITQSAYTALIDSGITLVASTRGENSADMLLTTHMDEWAHNNAPPGVILLISGDKIYNHPLQRLGLRGYKIMLAHPQATSFKLVQGCDIVWQWRDLCDGYAPYFVREEAMYGFGSKGPTSTAVLKSPDQVYYSPVSNPSTNEAMVNTRVKVVNRTEAIIKALECLIVRRIFPSHTYLVDALLRRNNKLNVDEAENIIEWALDSNIITVTHCGDQITRKFCGGRIQN